MRSKKWSIIVSLIIMGISVLIFSILNFRLYTTWFKNWMLLLMSPTILSDWKNFWVVISSGTFASSIVTLLISVSEYRVEKRIALEKYAEANIHFCADFYNMQYLNIRVPMKLLQGYYAEQWQPKRINKHQGNDKDDGQSATTESEAKIKAWIWDNTNDDAKEMFDTDEKRKEYLDSDFKHMIQKYDEEIDAVMKQYITLSDKVNKRELNTTIGEVDFLFGNKYRKEVLYKRMYVKNTETINKIKEVAYYFKEYYSAENGNKPLVLRFIHQIQEYMFSLEENAEWCIVHNQYLFEMNCEIDNLLRKLYGKKRYHDEPPKIKDFTVVSYWKGVGTDIQEKQECQDKAETNDE